MALRSFLTGGGGVAIVLGVGLLLFLAAVVGFFPRFVGLRVISTPKTATGTIFRRNACLETPTPASTTSGYHEAFRSASFHYATIPRF